MPSVLIRGEKRETQEQCDNGVLLPQAKKHLELSETRRTKAGFSPRGFKGSLAQKTPYF